MRVVSLLQPAATLTVTRQPCDQCGGYGAETAPTTAGFGGIGGMTLTEVPCRRCAGSMVSRWVTFDYACPSEVVGTRIAIAATEDEPALGLAGRVGDWNVYEYDFRRDGHIFGMEKWPTPSESIALPLGVVVGSAIVEASYPIHDRASIVGTNFDTAIIERDGDTLTHWNPHGAIPTDISDQLPYCDWSPGRFAWLLTEAEALPEPVRWVSSGGRLPEWQPT